MNGTETKVGPCGTNTERSDFKKRLKKFEQKSSFFQKSCFFNFFKFFANITTSGKNCLLCPRTIIRRMFQPFRLKADLGFFRDLGFFGSVGDGGVWILKKQAKKGLTGQNCQLKIAQRGEGPCGSAGGRIPEKKKRPTPQTPPPPKSARALD